MQDKLFWFQFYNISNLYFCYVIVAQEEKPFDPFGDSFRPLPGSTNSSGGKSGISLGSSTLPSSAKTRGPPSSSGGSTVSIANAPPPLAPPPLTGRTRHDSAQSRGGQHHHHQHLPHAAAGSMTTDSDHFEFATKFPVDFNNMTRPGAQSVPPHDVHEDRYAVFKDVRPASDESLTDFKNNSSFVNNRLAMSHEAVDSRGSSGFDDEWSMNDLTRTSVANDSDNRRGGTTNYDVFTELDPLGTGKIRPFIDKKDFFNDVRKQTKRLLRELGDGEDSLPGSPRTQAAGVIPTEVSMLVASSSLYSTSGIPYTSSETIFTHQAVIQNIPTSATSTTPMHMSAIASHSFSESFSPPQDSYEDYRAAHQSTDLQQFDTNTSGFADFNRFSGESPRSQRSEMSSSSMPDEPPPPLPVGTLTVALPPESFRDSPPSFSPPHSQGSSQLSPQPQKRLLKQLAVQQGISGGHACEGGVSPKTLPRSHKFGQQESIDGDWDAPGQRDHSQLDGDYNSYDTPRTLTADSPGHSLHCPVSGGGLSSGGTSPRPRPRSSLSKHLGTSSATLPLRQTRRFESSKYSHDQNFEPSYNQDHKFIHDKKFDIKYGDEEFSPLDTECRPFPNDEMNLEYVQAPVPPPRPAPIEPPPLPPKRQPTHVTLRPPPRPPTSSVEAHYLYINDKYDHSPEELQASQAASPPIPLPLRKPRYSEPPVQPSSVPNRANKPSFNAEPFHFPRPNLSPTHDSSVTGAIPKLASSRDSTPSKTSTPLGKSPRSGKRPSTGSIDLTNTSLDQLASKLEIPVEQLAKMTVVELAACLAQLQLKQVDTEEEDDRENSSRKNSSRFSGGEGLPNSRQGNANRDLSQERSSVTSGNSLREQNRFDDEVEFARFDAQFTVSPVNTPEFPRSLDGRNETSRSVQSLRAPVPEDRYAVFRELTVTTKQKSVFDENFLTPQNSMEDEASEISSGTFKVNFVPPDFRQDSMDQKSSISDDLDHERDPKQWGSSGLNEDEGVTIFRSPDISEYENFEPNFEAKFADDYNSSDKHSLDAVEIATLRSPASLKLSSDSGKSPFTDDFSCVSQEEIARTLNATKSSNESLGKFEDDFIPPVQTQDKYAVFRELAMIEKPSKSKSSTSSKSTFDDNFVDNGSKEIGVLDSGFLSTSDADKFDDVFQDAEIIRDENERSRKFNTNPETDSLNVAQEDNDSLNKSPFDDDFTNRSDRYEVLKEVESEREPSMDGEAAPEDPSLGRTRSSPSDGSWHGSNRHTPNFEELKFSSNSPRSVQDERISKFIPDNSCSPAIRERAATIDCSPAIRERAATIDSSNYELHAPPSRVLYQSSLSFDARNKTGETRESPYEDCINGSREVSMEMSNSNFFRSASNRQRRSLGNSFDHSPSSDRRMSPYTERRMSPYSDAALRASPSLASGRSHLPPRLSVGSDCGGVDVRQTQSPFDDNFSSAIGSVAEEVTFEAAFPSLQPLSDNATDGIPSINDPFANEKVDDVFVSEHNSFADFENAFHHNQSDGINPRESNTPTPRTPNPSFDIIESEDGDEVFPSDDAVEFRVSARYAPTSQDDPDDIFRRNSDPFADDFFSDDNLSKEENASAAEEDIKTSELQTRPQTGENNWQEPFEVFNFSSNNNRNKSTK